MQQSLYDELFGCFTVGVKNVKVNANPLLRQLTLCRHLAFDTEDLASDKDKDKSVKLMMSSHIYLLYWIHSVAQACKK